MKIAILSLVPGHNYGGILQSYALQTILERMGHHVEIITHDIVKVKKKNEWKQYTVYIVRFLKKYILGKQIYIKAEEKGDYQNALLRQFVNKYLHTREIGRFSEIGEFDYDAYIVGSDQVWRPKYFEEQYNAPIENAYLSFTKGWNVKRVSYAPSYAVDVWEYTENQTLEIKKLITQFNAVSVREENAVQLVKDNLDILAVQVLDPTFLLEKKDYQVFHSQNTKKGEKDLLLVYVLEKRPEIIQTANLIGKYLKLESRNLNDRIEMNEDGIPVKSSVELWLSSFSESDFVITDSFHACAFSIIYNRPFAVMANKKRGRSRIDSLLKQFQQSYRLIDGIEDFKNKREKLMLPPNVNDRLEASKLQSMAFLKDALS